MPKQKLSKRQKTILAYIKSYRNTHGFSPSIEEIRAACSLSSKSVVFYNLTKLEEYMRINRVKGIARSITIL